MKLLKKLLCYLEFHVWQPFEGTGKNWYKCSNCGEVRKKKDQ